MTGYPIKMYYELHNFYQNHRRYVKSKSDAQLRGENVSVTVLNEACTPIVVVENGSIEVANDFLLPCGLQANTMFNDSFILVEIDEFDNATVVNMTKKGIAWESDVEHKYKNPSKYIPGVRTIPDLTDEDFIVWMRPAGLPNFRKLYRHIDGDLVGDFRLIINNCMVWILVDGRL